MLSPQEALLLQAARDEQARQESLQAAGLTGALGGAAIGAAAGQVPHMVLKNTAGDLIAIQLVDLELEWLVVLLG